jgi:hypothetical protein
LNQIPPKIGFQDFMGDDKKPPHGHPKETVPAIPFGEVSIPRPGKKPSLRPILRHPKPDSRPTGRRPGAPDPAPKTIDFVGQQ